MRSTLGTTSLLDAIEVCSPVKNRRAETRRRPSDVRWLRGARLKYGPEVRIIDISPTGILFRNEQQLPNNTIIVVELKGLDGTALVPARVVRCRKVHSGSFVWYEVGCRFRRSIEFAQSLPDVRARSTATARIVEFERSAEPRSAAGGRSKRG